MTVDQASKQHPDTLIIIPQEAAQPEKYLEELFLGGIKSTYFLNEDNQDNLDWVDVELNKGKPRYRFDGKPKKR